VAQTDPRRLERVFANLVSTAIKSGLSRNSCRPDPGVGPGHMAIIFVCR
jgi:signal transduction histidine kinase